MGLAFVIILDSLCPWRVESLNGLSEPMLHDFCKIQCQIVCGMFFGKMLFKCSLIGTALPQYKTTLVLHVAVDFKMQTACLKACGLRELLQVFLRQVWRNAVQDIEFCCHTISLGGVDVHWSCSANTSLAANKPLSAAGKPAYTAI